jgi:hypothetical protein
MASTVQPHRDQICGRRKVTKGTRSGNGDEELPVTAAARSLVMLALREGVATEGLTTIVQCLTARLRDESRRCGAILAKAYTPDGLLEGGGTRGVEWETSDTSCGFR